MEQLGDNDGVRTLTAGVSVTNSTAVQTLCSYPVPAGFLRVGSEYQFEAMVNVSRGATATVANLVVSIQVAGVAVRTLTIAIPTGSGSNRLVWVKGWLTVRTVGASGTAMVSLMGLQDLTGSAATMNRVMDPAAATSAPAATTIDTTQSRTLVLDAAMSAAVAGLTMYVTHATLVKVR